MDRTTAATAFVGLAFGGLVGFGLGRYIEKREHGEKDRGLATELLSVVGGIAGGVATALIVNAVASSVPQQTASAPAQLPPVPASTPTTAAATGTP